MNRPVKLIASLIALVTALPGRAQTTTTTTTSGPTTRISYESATTAPANAMPREALEAIDRVELGDKYDPAQADRLYLIHKLLEKYFATDSQEDRKALTKWIASLGVDANVIGRICRIRMDWPELAPGPYYINDRVGVHDVRYFLGVPAGDEPSQPW